MRELDWQVSSMEQVCTSCLPPLLNLEHLYIYENPRWRQHWQDNIENALWLELLHPFTSVKNLFLSKDIARRIVPALQELVGDRATEVLPTLLFFSWRNANHRDRSRRAFNRLLPCDRLPVALLQFLTDSTFDLTFDIDKLPPPWVVYLPRSIFLLPSFLCITVI